MESSRYSPELQPALLSIAHGLAQACQERGVRPGGVLGHSFGEYAALVVAGSLSFDDAIGLAATRGRAMARLADGSGSMLAVIGLPDTIVSQVRGELREGGRAIHIAAYNSSTQTVLSGEADALPEAASRCRSLGAKRTRILQVPFAAHSPFMTSVREQLVDQLQKVSVAKPTVPFYSTVTGAFTTDPTEIRELLLRGVTDPVRFRQAVVTALRQGYETVVEIGSAWPPTLLGFVRDISRDDLPGRRTPLLSAVTTDDDAPNGRLFTSSSVLETSRDGS
ncbi:acyltransferase domain-containing protein [Streptomyces cinnabarinus]|uniref:[acyl-carrier-protein] S-malonyltransferase n=1 Tax=Streptomyces cinnabarinus TaxID=67287 RepID=A0ABY7KTK4_9ACTN|nr:acyltransferase domain-containing protein [Streptomyces cinnabarinus]WAZ26980.1 acyltransferase domain-containing protein [Streptomyces cinnabarinus]